MGRHGLQFDQGLLAHLNRIELLVLRVELRVKSVSAQQHQRRGLVPCLDSRTDARKEVLLPIGGAEEEIVVVELADGEGGSDVEPLRGLARSFLDWRNQLAQGHLSHGGRWEKDCSDQDQWCQPHPRPLSNLHVPFSCSAVGQLSTRPSASVAFGAAIAALGGHGERAVHLHCHATLEEVDGQDQQAFVGFGLDHDTFHAGQWAPGDSHPLALT